LLTCLMSAGFGCYIGHMFTGAVAYADDIALMAPSIRAMRQMQICSPLKENFNFLPRLLFSNPRCR